jgi:hypothetical protein
MPQPIKYSLLPPEATSHAAGVVGARLESHRQADRAQQTSARKPPLPLAARATLPWPDDLPRISARPRTSEESRSLRLSLRRPST